jgi:hypothetical protein|tara:strand:+ start:208 stop:408 length:201 start_codon:yes stop_codon:yes gene_type:complete
MCSKYFSKLICLILTLPLYSLACPYCAGQSGENYIESIIIPVAGLLMAPFLLFGVMSGVVYFYKDK